MGWNQQLVEDSEICNLRLIVGLTSQWGEEKKRKSIQEGSTKSRRTTNEETDADAHHPGDSTWRCLESYASRNGISDLSQPRSGQHSSQPHDDIFRMAKEHGERGTSSISLGSHHGSDSEGKISKDCRSTFRERAPDSSTEEPFGGRAEPVPLLGMEQGSEKTDSLQIQTIDSDGEDLVVTSVRFTSLS